MGHSKKDGSIAFLSKSRDYNYETEINLQNLIGNGGLNQGRLNKNRTLVS